MQMSHDGQKSSTGIQMLSWWVKTNYHLSHTYQIPWCKWCHLFFAYAPSERAGSHQCDFAKVCSVIHVVHYCVLCYSHISADTAEDDLRLIWINCPQLSASHPHSYAKNTCDSLQVNLSLTVHGEILRMFKMFKCSKLLLLLSLLILSLIWCTIRSF